MVNHLESSKAMINLKLTFLTFIGITLQSFWVNTAFAVDAYPWEFALSAYQEESELFGSQDTKFEAKVLQGIQWNDVFAKEWNVKMWGEIVTEQYRSEVPTTEDYIGPAVGMQIERILSNDGSWGSFNLGVKQSWKHYLADEAEDDDVTRVFVNFYINGDGTE